MGRQSIESEAAHTDSSGCSGSGADWLGLPQDMESRTAAEDIFWAYGSARMESTQQYAQANENVPWFRKGWEYGEGGQAGCGLEVGAAQQEGEEWG